MVQHASMLSVTHGVICKDVYPRVAEHNCLMSLH